MRSKRTKIGFRRASVSENSVKSVIHKGKQPGLRFGTTARMAEHLV
jgi:hypothetical protein